MQDRFILGDEWVYYKLYCGKKTADTFLIDVIKPFTEKMLKEKIIDKWFFIRYNDPNNHLRIRFHLEDISKLGKVVESFKNAIVYYTRNDFIWKVQIDTYQREIERYGKNTIIQSEDLFFYDSVVSVNALSLIEDDELLFLFTLKSIDKLLTAFKFNLKSKIMFTKYGLRYFEKELNIDKCLRKQLNRKYRILRCKVELFMESEQDENFKNLFEALENKNSKVYYIKSYILRLWENNKLSISLDSLLFSYIHMMVNRKFRDKQRVFELLCHYSLFRYYDSKLAKNKVYEI